MFLYNFQEREFCDANHRCQRKTFLLRNGLPGSFLPFGFYFLIYCHFVRQALFLFYSQIQLIVTCATQVSFCMISDELTQYCLFLINLTEVSYLTRLSVSKLWQNYFGRYYSSGWILKSLSISCLF